MRLRSVPKAFRHGGFVLGDSFTEFDKLTKEQRETLRDFHGRYIRVHPDDRADLPKIGLEFESENEPLVDLKAKTPSKSDEDGDKNKTANAPKTGEKKD